MKNTNVLKTKHSSLFQLDGRALQKAKKQVRKAYINKGVGGWDR